MNVETYRHINYGGSTIEFEIIRSDRLTLNISVHPNQQVTVKAPTDTRIEEIDRRVRSHARWILKQQQFFEQFEPRTPPRQYISGETHLYLGRQYRLKVQHAPYGCLKLKGRYLHVETPKPDYAEMTRDLLNQWYLERAHFKFNERLDACFTVFQKLGFERPVLQIRRLSKRWGSLTDKGAIILNRDLIRASSSYIDYVIMHELCHLKYATHNNDFFDLLSSVLPDWEVRKSKLERMLI